MRMEKEKEKRGERGEKGERSAPQEIKAYNFRQTATIHTRGLAR